MSVCVVGSLINPYSDYRRAFGGVQLIPVAAGRAGLSVAFVF
jgi:hypothetical protein